MQQKLTTIVLLSTVIGISAGTSAQASGPLLADPSIQKVPTPELLDKHLTTQIAPVENPATTSDRGIDDNSASKSASNSASIENPLSTSDPVDDVHAPSVVTSPKAFDETEAIPLPEPMLPEEIGGLNLHQSGVLVSQQVPATPPPQQTVSQSPYQKLSQKQKIQTPYYQQPLYLLLSRLSHLQKQALQLRFRGLKCWVVLYLTHQTSILFCRLLWVGH